MYLSRNFSEHFQHRKHQGTQRFLLNLWYTSCVLHLRRGNVYVKLRGRELLSPELGGKGSCDMHERGPLPRESCEPPFRRYNHVPLAVLILLYLDLDYLFKTMIVKAYSLWGRICRSDSDPLKTATN